MTSLHVVVRGVVQGVGFRWFVRESARRVALAGWVKNRDDGAVEVAASGDEAAIDALRDALTRGPDDAVVATIEELTIVAEPLPRPFTVLR